jgi:maltodextrin utilization protein YvdJ
MLLAFGLAKLNTTVHWAAIDVLLKITAVASFFYLYKALRNFYQQGRAKTIIKFLLLCFSFLMVLSILLLGFVFSSLLKL